MITKPITVITNITGMFFHSIPPIEPTCHSSTADNESGSPQSFIIVVMALKMYIIAMPAMIMVVGEAFFILETNMIAIVGINAKMNAFRTIEYSSVTIEAPSTIASVAPNPAPDDTPVVYGSAKGFFRMLCMVTPHMARADPAIIPTMIFGSLNSQIV